MKKLLVFCFAFSLIAIFFLASLSGYRSLQGDDVRVYTRFFTTDSTGTHFNWLGLLSPIQTESQKVVTDTVRFSHKVVYPYGKNFQCVNPTDTTAEQFVANEIGQVINDSITKIRFNTSLDYDGTALAVRKSANPNIRTLARPTVELKLLGTASPEARKYGFEQSLMPGHFEPENDTLAHARLERTAEILAEKGFPATTSLATELQFSDTASAMMAIQNPAILDGLRWVEASVTIPIERLEVMPATAPVLFPFWLWLSAFGLMLLWRLRLPKMQRPKLYWGTWSWGGLWEFVKILLYCIGASILLATLIVFVDWKWVLLLLALLIAGGLAYLMLRYIDEITNAIVDFFLWIIRALISIVLFIWGLLVSIWKWIVKIWDQLVKWFRRMQRRFAICWACLTPCWKRVFIFVTIYAVIMTALVIYLI